MIVVAVAVMIMVMAVVAVAIVVVAIHFGGCHFSGLRLDHCLASLGGANSITKFTRPRDVVLIGG